MPSATSTKPNGVVAASPPPSKADWVRSQPASMTVKEIVEKAAAAGMKLDLSSVYKARKGTTAKAAQPKAAKPTAAKPTTAPKRAAKPAPVAVAPVEPNGQRPSSAEDLLKAVAAEIGLGRAIEILAGERARVRAVIGA